MLSPEEWTRGLGGWRDEHDAHLVLVALVDMALVVDASDDVATVRVPAYLESVLFREVDDAHYASTPGGCPRQEKIVVG